MRDAASLCFGVALLVGLVALAVFYPPLMRLWWYWCPYVFPAVLIPMNIHGICKELNLRKRIKSGEIEVVEVGGFILIHQTCKNEYH